MKNLFMLAFVFSLFIAESALAMQKIKLPQISSYGPSTTPSRKIASNPANITVIKVENSRYDSAEKWVDHSTGVVCYSIGSHNKKSISCVKMK